LDDFSSLYLDSTATAANTERPTDSGLITKLVERICRTGTKLDRFDLPNFNPSGLEELQKDLRGMHREIGFSTGKAKSQGKLKKLYYKTTVNHCDSKDIAGLRFRDSSGMDEWLRAGVVQW
jgi:hypothetical protein